MRTYLFRYKELPTSNWTLYTTYITEVEAKNMFGGKARYECLDRITGSICFKDEETPLVDQSNNRNQFDITIPAGDVMKRDTSGGFFVDVDKYNRAVAAIDYLVKHIVPFREHRDTYDYIKNTYKYEL